MLQIYKVFHSKSEIIFSQNKIDNQSIIIDDFSDVSKYNSLNKFLFTCISPDPIKAIKNWFPDHDFIQAAGGLVMKDQQYLWIYRNGTWDLPKGKLEKDENFKIAAIREVKEECGLDSNLEIIKLLYISFHTYIENSKSRIKRTNWYLMKYSGSDYLSPQKEEGIDKVKWLSLEESILKSKESFKSIDEVWKAYN